MTDTFSPSRFRENAEARLLELEQEITKLQDTRKIINDEIRDTRIEMEEVRRFLRALEPRTRKPKTAKVAPKPA